MWIFLNDAYLSIVADERSADKLLVRARVKGDITRVFPNAKVLETPEADYRYRTSLPRTLVMGTVVDRISKIGYPNFKSSIPYVDGGIGRHSTYLTVWHDLCEWQDKLHPKPTIFADNKPEDGAGTKLPDVLKNTPRIQSDIDVKDWVRWAKKK